jgi:hypothetical protein
MPLFRKKGLPPLDHPDVVALLRMAVVDLNYGAVTDLHRIYVSAAPADKLWDWWLDEAHSLARSGDTTTAALAVDFARKANVDPWGPLRSDHYDRMRVIEGT